MAIYLIYMASPAIVYVLLEAFTHKVVNEDAWLRKIFLFICGTLMALMIGLRHKYVGSSDSAFYYRFWETMSKLPLADLRSFMEDHDMEKGYQIAVWFFSHIFPKGQYSFVISGIFYAISVCAFTQKNCKNVMLALMVFICLGVFNFMVQGMRQAIAMCICLWALEPCKERKFLKFALLVALACTFHMSAIVFSVVYFIKGFDLKTKSILLFTVLAGIFVLFLPSIFNLMNTLINDSYGTDQGSESGGVVAILIYLVSIIFGLFFQDRDDSNYPLFIYITIVAMMALVLRNTVNSIAERIGDYFTFGQMVILSNSIASLKDDKEKTMLVLFATLLVFGVAIHKASYSNLVPYIFYWQY